jgi:hypothetical protein
MPLALHLYFKHAKFFESKMNCRCYLKHFLIGTLQSRNRTGRHYNEMISNEINFSLVKCRLYECKKSSNSSKEQRTKLLQFSLCFSSNRKKG